MWNIVDCSGGLNGTGGITASRAGSGWRFRLNPGLYWVVGILSLRHQPMVGMAHCLALAQQVLLLPAWRALCTRTCR
ncbi:hypothetical protein D3C86_1247570 [compost metagenome]